jgi:uncharacterized protein YajQ (UPF0234 family)
LASDSSFDVVSRVDGQELDNALNQTRKEIENRFDFKNSKTSIEYDGKKITLISDDELKMKNVVDVFGAKAVKRGIDLRAFEYGPVEPAANSTVRQVVTPRSGITKDQSRVLLAHIKNLKLKVTAQFQDEQLRVSAKSKDELQKAITALRSMEFELPLQFVNYR